MSKILIKNALIVNEGKAYKGSIVISNEIIADIIPNNNPIEEFDFTEIIDAEGKILLPGVIDDQVHFRQPGMMHKGDIFSESKAAVAGGITSYMEMPNTVPQTITQELLEQKFEIAERDSLANFSFYIGATNDNLSEILKTDPKRVCGVKVFMGSSTGNMLVDDTKTLEGIFKESPVLVATHCEEESIIRENLAKYTALLGNEISVKYHPLIRSIEACYASSSKAVALATRYNTRLHVLHLSTAKETELFSSSIPLAEKRITAEVCIHHLWFTDQDYEKLGNFIKWNPAIKFEEDRDTLWKALLEGRIDVIATDHAPHTLVEKNNHYLQAPSGGPLVQHALPAMLEFVKEGKITLEQLVHKMCHAPAEIFHVYRRGYLRKGYFADLVIVDPNKPWTVSRNNIFYKCGWSPFENYTFYSSITHTFVNGKLVYNNGTFNETVRGTRLIFER
ncbi:MAG: dihydroorotase [Bacteroidales bacterium]|nr:dihydroorotase [Bacteroidales bacterium]